MPNRDLICVGASAGGVPALLDLLRPLPRDLPAAIMVVLHISANRTSVLPRILTAGGELEAVHPEDGDPIERGKIYVAPADHHLLVEEGRVRVAHSASENGHRPAIDPLFRTAALSYGPRAIGVILTGALDDGAAGLRAIQLRGGLTLVEDPETAFCADMPRNALELVKADQVLPVAELGKLLPRLAAQTVNGAPAPSPLLLLEAEIALRRPQVEILPPGEPSSLGCPACGGVLNEVHDGKVRFRCRTGHAYGGASLLNAQQASVEGALWAALRALEEQATLGRRMESRANEQHNLRSARRFAERAGASEEQAELIRRLLGVSVADPKSGD